MICVSCGRDVDRLLFGSYCSFTCKSRDNRKKDKKPPTTGSRARKVRIRGMVKNYTSADWQKVLAHFDSRCAYCGKPGHMQQEHFLPVHLGGHYTPDNIIPACAGCNSKKKEKDPFEWLVQQEHGLVAYARITQWFDGL